MKKASIIIMLTLMTLALVGGLAGAQSTYQDPPEVPDIPGAPDECTRVDMLDLKELTLTVGGSSATLTATIPAELEPYEVSWVSTDNSIATVTAQSAATVTPVGPGTCRIYVFVASGGESYCDFAEVRVLAAEGATPTPPTAGGITLFTGTMIGLLLIFAALSLVRRLRLES